MKITFRHYTSSDLIKIRDFLVNIYSKVDNQYNWTIERWNFVYSLDRVMNGISVEEWEKRIGIWEEDGEILAIVNSEGEGGHAFFQIAKTDISDELFEEMFEFAEKKIAVENHGEVKVFLRIPEGDHQREQMALKRGYMKTEWNEPISVIAIEDRPKVTLPKGFTIKTGDELTDAEKSVAHGQAFGYFTKEIYMKRSQIGYGIMRTVPDYRADLDLYVITDCGEVASFCTIWYDKVNQHGILEPVGTHADFQKMGLASSVVAEGLNRIAKEGAKKAFVGSSQDFYKAIGFKQIYNYNIWRKIII